MTYNVFGMMLSLSLSLMITLFDHCLRCTLLFLVVENVYLKALCFKYNRCCAYSRFMQDDIVVVKLPCCFIFLHFLYTVISVIF